MNQAQEFIEAVKEGQQAEVDRMLEQSPELVNAKDDNGVSAALWAMYRGHRELANSIVEKGAQLNLFEASAVGNEAVVQRLVAENPTAINEYSPDGFTALALACFFGNPAALDALLAAGANPNAVAQNRMKVTPLHSAVAHRVGTVALAMTKTLLAHNAEVNISQEGGWTPLHQAAAHGQNEIVEQLLARGANLDAQSDDGRTALQMAEEAKHTQTVELLRKHQAQPQPRVS